MANMSGLLHHQEEAISSTSSLSSSDQHNTDPVPIVSGPDPQVLQKTFTGASVQSRLSNKTLRRPRNERRGLLAQVTLIPEFHDARDYPMALKTVLVLVIAIAAMIGPMGTSIVFPAIDSMIEDLNTTSIMVNVSVGIYLLALGIFPLWWSSFSERLGRRTVYIASFTMYIGFAIGAALSPSISSLIVFRVLTGACSASVQAVGAGTISDLFPPEQRGRAMGYFYLGALASPLVSPIIGSLLLITWDWRSTQWFTMGLAAVIDLCIILLLPETLREQNNKATIARILQERRMNKEVDDRDEEENIIERLSTRLSIRAEHGNPETMSVVETVDRERLMEVEEADEKRLELEISESLKHKNPSKWSRFKRQFYEFVLRPLKAVYFLQYPPVALSISFSSLTFAVLYLMNMTLQYEFSRAPYNWRPLFIGLAYIPNSVAYIIASIYGGKWTDKLYKDYVKKQGFASAESRISYNMLSAVICYPVALLITGWCFHYHTFWVTPLIGTAIFGYATMMTIGPTVTYLVDSLPGRGATGVAVNNLCRQTCATAAVFLVDPMIEGIGPGPMCSMFAGVVVLWSVVLLILKKRGKYWRENYDLQALYDKLE
jgi:multidrug resistance protein